MDTRGRVPDNEISDATDARKTVACSATTGRDNQPTPLGSNNRSAIAAAARANSPASR